jgi:PknH-like extracellular domain
MRFSRAFRGQLVTAAICAAALASCCSGCMRTVDGAAAAPVGQATANHTTAPTTIGQPPRTVPVAALESLLLPVDQLIALVGGTNMALVGTANSTSDARQIIDDRRCLGLGSVGDVASYSNSGYVAMRGNQFSTPNAVQADVTQLVTSFTAAADAQALLQRAQQDWQGCANRRYGFHSSNGNHSYFDTNDVRGSGSRIELSMRQEEDASWGCSHAMAVQNNVVAEARVCLLGKDPAPAVNNLLDQIAAKIPQ